MNEIFFAAFHDELEKLAAMNIKRLVGRRLPSGQEFTRGLTSRKVRRPGKEAGYTMTGILERPGQEPNELLMGIYGPKGELIKNNKRTISGVKPLDSNKTFDLLNELAKNPYAGKFYGFPGT